MEYEEIENLTNEQIDEFYKDIIDFNSENLAGCCCVGGPSEVFSKTFASCTYWCRRQGARCSGWFGDYDSRCTFRC